MKKNTATGKKQNNWGKKCAASYRVAGIPMFGLQTNFVTWWSMPELFENNKSNPISDNRFEKVCDWLSDDENERIFLYAAYILDILLLILAGKDIVNDNLATAVMIIASAITIIWFVISADVSTYLFLKSKQRRRIKMNIANS